MPSRRRPTTQGFIIDNSTPRPSRREVRRAEEAARKREAAEAPTQRVSDRDDRDELRAAYDAMLQRDGAPLNPASAETEQIAVIEKKPKVKKRRRWMWWVFTPVALLLALGACGLIFYNQAMGVRDDLTTMKSELNVLLDQVKAGDTAASDKTAAHIAELSARSNATVDTLLWDVAANVPFVGANVEAVAETTKAVDIVIREALPSVTQLISTFDVKGSKLDGGGIDLQPFRDAGPMLPALSATLAKAQTHIDKIDRADLMPFVEENISQVADMITQATPLIQMGEKYLPTILQVLADGGTRTYALIIQNNAEIHATGGNPGNIAIVSVSNGAITMREDDNVKYFSAFGYGGTGYEDVQPPEKGSLFEWDTTLYMANYTRFPEFNDTVAYVDRLWVDATGEAPLDGIISIDPVVLSYMLGVTGPVDVPGYRDQVTQENTVPMLLSEAYEETSSGAESQAYFDAISSAIFNKFASGGWDPLKMYAALQKGVEQQRVYMHFKDPTEQQMVEDGGMGGHLALDTSKVAQVGIYLNNASYSKLEYYLTTSMAVTCDAGARTVTTAITMHNSIPGADLSNYTLGGRNADFGYPRTSMLLDVMSFALPGGQLVASSPEEGENYWQDREGNYNGLEGRSMFISVAKDETVTVSYTSTVPEGITVPLQVRYSPTVTDTPVTIQDSCGQLFPGTVTTGP